MFALSLDFQVQSYINNQSKLEMCNSVLDVIFQTRVRLCYRGFQTRENWWKPEAVGRGLLLFSSVWKTLVKHEAQVFEMTSQSAPNCKEKIKRKQKNRRMQKSQACDFCLLLFNLHTVCDDNVHVFHNWSFFLFQVVTICIQWRAASSETWTG